MGATRLPAPGLVPNRVLGGGASFGDLRLHALSVGAETPANNTEHCEPHTPNPHPTQFTPPTRHPCRQGGGRRRGKSTTMTTMKGHSLPHRLLRHHHGFHSAPHQRRARATPPQTTAKDQDASACHHRHPVRCATKRGRGAMGSILAAGDDDAGKERREWDDLASP